MAISNILNKAQTILANRSIEATTDISNRSQEIESQANTLAKLAEPQSNPANPYKSHVFDEVVVKKWVCSAVMRNIIFTIIVTI